MSIARAFALGLIPVLTCLATASPANADSIEKAVVHRTLTPYTNRQVRSYRRYRTTVSWIAWAAHRVHRMAKDAASDSFVRSTATSPATSCCAVGRNRCETQLRAPGLSVLLMV